MTELKPTAVREYSIALVRRSWWYYVRSLLAGAVLVGLGLYLIYRSLNMMFGLGLVVAGLLIWAVIPVARRSLSWLITSDRLIEECGILATRRRQLELQDIRSIEVTRSLLQRLTGLGDVVIASAASAEYLIRLSDVYDPDGVAETVRKARLRRLG
jgi:uncharacterized membrane protein YdbT with pleckstrin-like domain